MIPGPPPVMTVYPIFAIAAPISRAFWQYGLLSGSMEDPKMLTDFSYLRINSNPSVNSLSISETRFFASEATSSAVMGLDAFSGCVESFCMLILYGQLRLLQTLFSVYCVISTASYNECNKLIFYHASTCQNHYCGCVRNRGGRVVFLVWNPRYDGSVRWNPCWFNESTVS